jgi:hypothetical protein
MVQRSTITPTDYRSDKVHQLARPRAAHHAAEQATQPYRVFQMGADGALVVSDLLVLF